MHEEAKSKPCYHCQKHILYTTALLAMMIPNIPPVHITHAPINPTTSNSYISGFVVGVAVVEDLAEIHDALLGTVVAILLKLFLDIPHVHWTLNDVKIVLQIRKNKADYAARCMHAQVQVKGILYCIDNSVLVRCFSCCNLCKDQQGASGNIHCTWVYA